MGERAGEWSTHLASLGIPFGTHSLHSNYIRVWLVTKQPIGIEESAGTRVQLMFELGHPNPFRRHITAHYTLDNPATVELCVYDASGRFINCLVRGTVEPGEYHAIWDGKDERGHDVSSGIYFVRYRIGDSQKVQKAVLVK